MEILEKKLNKLPKASLSKKADILINARLHKAMRQRKLEYIKSLFAFNFKYATAAFVLVVLVFCSVVPGYAYASKDVTYGHKLYGIKKAVEDIELALSFNDLSKVKTYEKMIDKRLDEAKYLLENKTDEGENIIKTVSDLNVLREEVNLFVTNVDIADFAAKKDEEQFIKLVEIAKTANNKKEASIVDETMLAINKTSGGFNYKSTRSDDLNNADGFILDSDGDGLSDNTEDAIGSDKENPDTDGDSYNDGLEVKNGYSPVNGNANRKTVNAGLGSLSEFESMDEGKKRGVMNQISLLYKFNIRQKQNDLIKEGYEEGEVGEMVDILDSKVGEMDKIAGSGDSKQFKKISMVVDGYLNNSQYIINKGKRYGSVEKSETDEVEINNNLIEINNEDSGNITNSDVIKSDTKNSKNNSSLSETTKKDSPGLGVKAGNDGNSKGGAVLSEPVNSNRDNNKPETRNSFELKNDIENNLELKRSDENLDAEVELIENIEVITDTEETNYDVSTSSSGDINSNSTSTEADVDGSENGNSGNNNSTSGHKGSSFGDYHGRR